MPELQRRTARFEPPFMRLSLRDIGGGRVTRAFNMDGKRVNVGTVFSREDILNINAANRSVLLDRFINVWPISGALKSPSAAKVGTERAERYVVPLGFGSYHVVEGKMITAKPVGREEAYALAGKPMSGKKARKEH